MHKIVQVIPKPASEAGALDGHQAVCSCGERIGSSLLTLAQQWGREHVAYMNRKEA